MDKSFAVLVVEKSSLESSPIAHILKKYFKNVSVTVEWNSEIVSHKIKTGKFDFVVLCSYNDNFYYFDFLTLLKNVSSFIPVIVVMDRSTSDPESAVNLFKFGVYDVVFKDNLDRIVKSIKEFNGNTKHRSSLFETATEHYLRQIINSLDEEIIVLDKFGNIIDANANFIANRKETDFEIGIKCTSFLNMCRNCKKMCSFDNLNNNTDTNFTSEKDTNCRLEEVILTKKPVSFVYRRNQAKSEKWLKVMVSPVLEKGEVEKIIISYTDITREIEQTDRLLQLEKTVEQSPVSIIITDLTPKIQYVNPMFSNVTGYSANEAIGQNPRFLKSGQTSKKMYEEMWNTISQGGVWKGEFINKKKNGDIFYEFAVISPIKNAKGKITNYAAIKRDISVERELETKLEQSQKLEMLGYVASGIAHDFNNILTAILGFADLAKNYPGLPEKLIKYLEEIESASKKATSLTQQLLTFSRRKELKIENVDIYDLIFSFEKMVKRVLGDRQQIENILLNLCVNAAHSIREKNSTEKMITIIVENEEVYENPLLKDGLYTTFVVKDTGQGIPDRIINKIFDPFFTTKKPGEGTGLGLSMVLNTVKKAGGHIEVNSEEGVGTEFVVYLPCGEGATINTAKDDNLINKVDLSGITVLLVEDEIKVRNLTEKILQKVGCKVICASNGNEALELIKNQEIKIDIMFTDIIMPELDGVYLGKLAKEIREDLKIIYTSGYTDDFLEKYNVQRESLLILDKPYTPENLCLTIEKISKSD
jgi:PAS domain S-box-containing protein